MRLNHALQRTRHERMVATFDIHGNHLGARGDRFELRQANR